jgi:hypothetical protein
MAPPCRRRQHRPKSASPGEWRPPITNSLPLTIRTIQFDAGAPAYTFNVEHSYFLNGLGIVNNSANRAVFNIIHSPLWDRGGLQQVGIFPKAPKIATMCLIRVDPELAVEP